VFPLEGGCSCGQLRYRLDTMPLIVHCCHCTLCQRETGSAFAVNALIESAKVTVLGSVTRVTSPPCAARPTEQPPCGPPLAPVSDGGVVEPLLIKNPSESGFGNTMARCPTCATALWSHYAGAGPFLKFVRVGTLDRAWEIAPDVHIYTASRRDFVTLADGKPQFEGFYPTKDKLWRNDALERWAAIEDDVQRFRDERNKLGPKF